MGSNKRGADEAAAASHIINQAKAGDPFSCMTILSAIRNRILPSSALPDVLQMFATHIENSCPAEKSGVNEFQLAETSFTALTSTLMWLIDFEDTSMVLMVLRPVLQIWPSVLAWARARFIQNVHAGNRFSKDPGETWFQLGVFLDGISMLRNYNEFCLACNDRRVLELAMYLFLHEDNANIQYKIITMGFFDLYIETTILRCDDAVDVSWRRALDDIQSAAQGDPEVVLNPILALSTRTNREGGPIYKTLLACVEILGRFLGVLSHPMALTLKKKGSPSLSKVLGYLTGLAPDKQRTKDFTEAFGLCICIFAAFSDPGDGTNWLSQALRYPIFHSIAACSSLLSDAPSERLAVVKSLLSSILPAHVTYPSVIFACENALLKLSAEQHKQIMSSALAPAWKKYIYRFFEQYLFYCYFEIAGYHKGCYKCGTTASSGEKTALKKCGACKNVEYCSNACQTSDWSNHKKDCKGLRDRKNGPLPDWAIPLFNRRLAAYDARRHLPGIRALAAQKYPCFPLQVTAVYIDYRRFPPRLSVGLAGKERIEYDKLTAKTLNPMLRELCFDDVRLHDGSSSIVCGVDFESGGRDLAYQVFHWSPPYFSSSCGSLCRDPCLRTSFVTPCHDDWGRDVSTAWSVVDEIAYRGELNPQMIMEGRMGEIRRKVLEVVVREKSRMRVGG